MNTPTLFKDLPPVDVARELGRVDPSSLLGIVWGARSYEQQTLKDYPDILPRLFADRNDDEVNFITRRIFEIFEVGNALASGVYQAATPEDATRGPTRQYPYPTVYPLLYVWPLSGRVGFMAMDPREIQRHRQSDPASGLGHLCAFESQLTAIRDISSLHRRYASRDLRAWPVLGILPSGSGWYFRGTATRADDPLFL
jgi:hypothetical protein